MQFRRSADVRAVDREFLTQRQRAREQAFNSSLSMFDEIEITKYGLETARVDGSDNPLTFTWNRPLDLFGSNGLDVRGLENR